ncbi:hypothetical protein [Streptomyces mangrovisoli]|uniref:Uncharacterized protein n=1 Tax=Streptomyces mangrovisoli TaxID=1428628 RepID=A0A1J4NPT3_9ACTN|nr:hypothetical protein [Streptomyces mangrovisoli]OIJ63277.1 hypothetical protein WN71_034960 [Streptomyces mangrovisoli]
MDAVAGGGGGEPATGGVDLQTVGLALIADGIDKALGELGKLGFLDKVGWSGAGRGFDDLEMDALTIGGDTVGAAFHTFCERWQWGVRSLVAEGNGFAQAIGLSAGTMYQTDQTVKNSLKVGLNSLEGDPYATEQQVENKSWSQLATPGWTDPDYSARSFEDGAKNSEQVLKGMGRDIATDEVLPGVELGPLATGMDKDDYNAAVDHSLGLDQQSQPTQKGQG